MSDDFTKYWAQMWRIERQDGEVIALTDHDFDLEFDGDVYSARSALSSSAVDAAIGLEAENAECISGVDGDLIKAEDLKAGLFQDAKVRHFLYDFEAERLEHEIFAGHISKVVFSEGHFRAELASDLDKLDYVYGRKFSKTCDVPFCSQECGLIAEHFCERSKIVAVRGNHIEIVAKNSGYPFAHGFVAFAEEGGKNTRYAIREFAQEGDVWRVTLWRTPRFAIEPGGEVYVYAGCDKSFAQCKDVYGNALNFRGFPHIPGEQILSKRAGGNA